MQIVWNLSLLFLVLIAMCIMKLFLYVSFTALHLTSWFWGYILPGKIKRLT